MKSQTLFSLLAIAALAACCIPAASAEEAAPLDEGITLYNRASQALNTGDYAIALAYLNQALALNTSEFVSSGARNYALLDKSKIQIEMGNFTDALETIGQALALEETDKLWNNRGYVLYRLGRYDEAVQAYNTAIRITPNYTVALINKGDALMKQAKFGDAADAYEKALVSDALDNDLTLRQKATTSHDLGDAYMALGKYPQAVQSYKNSLTFDPGNEATAAHLKVAQQKADSASHLTIAAIIAVAIVCGGAGWYFLKRTKASPEAAEKGAENTKKKKKNPR